MKEPRNFSWVSDDVAGFGFPYSMEEIQFLVEECKIKHIITMCENAPDVGNLSDKVTVHHFPLPDNTAAVEVIERAVSVILKNVNKGEKCGVHCHYGQGRAGTVLACYLGEIRKLPGETAIKELRKMRENSVSSSSQKRAIIEYLKKYEK